MKDDVQFMKLWDLYSPLLTQTQKEITDLYFNFDLSLGEIAESAGITRQSVLDTVKKVKEKLDFYEKQLSLKAIYDGLKEIAEETDDNTSAKLKDLNEDFLSLGIAAKASFDTRRQEKALRTGNLLTGSLSFDLPMVESDYYKNQAFIPQFSINATDVYCKKVYKDYAIKARAFAGYNFGYLTNLSGDGAVRGLSLGSFSGFGYALANIEASIPVMYIDLYDTANYTHRQKVTYLMYVNLFVDGGFAFSNDDMKVRDYEYLEKNTYLKDFRCYLDDKNYFTYALSAGAGITFVPYFLHFVVRIDVGVNILEPILEQKAPSIGLTVSFNDMF